MARGGGRRGRGATGGDEGGQGAGEGVPTGADASDVWRDQTCFLKDVKDFLDRSSQLGSGKRFLLAFDPHCGDWTSSLLLPFSC